MLISYRKSTIEKLVFLMFIALLLSGCSDIIQYIKELTVETVKDVAKDTVRAMINKGKCKTACVVNMRSGPHHKRKIVMTLQKHSTIYLTGKKKGKWRQIKKR